MLCQFAEIVGEENELPPRRKARASRSKLNSAIRVLVTGVAGGGVGIGILEALTRARYEVYATDVTPYSVGLLKAEKGFLVPPAGEPTYLEGIRRICKQNRIEIIVPGSEAELFQLSKDAAKFEEEGLLVIANNHSLIANCTDKWKMFRMFRENGIPCPDSALPEQHEEFVTDHGFPFLLKQRTGTGSRNLFVVKSDDDYLFYSRKFRDQGVPFMLQQYVGKGSEEYTVGVVCRKDGSVLGSMTIHRLLQGMSVREKSMLGEVSVEISTGISQGIVEDNKNIQRQCEEYAVKLGVTGPANFQGRLVNELFTVFELNPRFSGSTPFRAGVGFNDVDLVIRDRLNQHVQKPVFRAGVVVLRSLQNTFVPLERIKKLSLAFEGASNG